MSSSEGISQTEQRIAEVSALQQTIAEFQNELHIFRDEVRKEIMALRQNNGGAPPAAPSVDPLPSVKRSRATMNLPPEVAANPAPPSRPVKVPSAAVGLPRSDIDDELDEMAAEDHGEAPPDEKESVSVGGRPVSVKVSDGMADSEPLSGWVIDRPTGGLRILVDEPMPVGTVISIRPTKEHPQNQWVNVSVKTCRPERNSYVIHVQFTERPPWAVMNLLNGM
jgi:hypothetical protein